MKMTEDIYHIRLNEILADFIAFDRQEADRILVFYWTSNINLRVDDIIISYDDDLTTTCTFVLNIFDQTIIELELVGQHFGSVSSRSTIRKVAIDQTYFLSFVNFL